MLERLWLKQIQKLLKQSTLLASMQLLLRTLVNQHRLEPFLLFHHGTSPMQFLWVVCAQPLLQEIQSFLNLHQRQLQLHGRLSATCGQVEFLKMYCNSYPCAMTRTVSIWLQILQSMESFLLVHLIQHPCLHRGALKSI